MAGTDAPRGSEGTMPRIVHTDDVLGGDPRIEGRRIGVHHVYHRYTDGGESAESIATSYDLSVAEVHAALAYAFDNLDEIREIESRNRAVFEENAEDRLRPEDVG